MLGASDQLFPSLIFASEVRITELEDAPLPSLYFAETFKKTKHGSKRIQIGFERLANAEEVFAIIRKLQSNDHAQTS